MTAAEPEWHETAKPRHHETNRSFSCFRVFVFSWLDMRRARAPDPEHARDACRATKTRKHENTKKTCWFRGVGVSRFRATRVRQQSFTVMLFLNQIGRASVGKESSC